MSRQLNDLQYIILDRPYQGRDIGKLLNYYKNRLASLDDDWLANDKYFSLADRLESYIFYLKGLSKCT
jgi:hypothetical protein